MTPNDVRTLRDQLLEVCFDYDEDDPVGVCTAALIDALMVFLACGAPTPQDARRFFKVIVEQVDLAIEAEWHAYRGGPS